MTIEPEKTRFSAHNPDPGPATMADFARYTRDMLESLRKIARQQELGMLAHLLELTQAEATLIIRDCQCQHSAPLLARRQAQQTRFPG